MAYKPFASKVNFFLLWINLFLKHFVQSQNPDVIEYTIYDDVQKATLIGNVEDKSQLRNMYSDEILRTLEFVFLSDGVHTDYFALDNSSGDIHAVQNVDRDDICPQAEVCAIRMDVAIQPSQYFQVLKVVITILDINDNAPEFEQESQSYDISEATSPGIIGPMALAKDLDSPKFGIVKYRLESNFDTTFGIDVKNSSSEFEVHLVLKKPLDRETVENYRLFLIAEDGATPARLGNLTLNIHILDVNDNNPTFESTRYEVNIPENLSPGASIVTIEATDADTGVNGEILYSFNQQTVEDMDGIFTIERTTGMIYLQKQLDYEQRKSYSLIVVAQDQGPNSLPANTRVLIKIMDVNDHVPRISMNTLGEDRLVKLEETAPKESFIAHMSVYDEDGDTNGQVQCLLTGARGMFKIIELYDKEFKIVTDSALDREQQASYNLHIRCQDNGTPQLMTQDTITVELQDVNDNVPEFSQDEYHAAIREHGPTDRSLVKVTAVDFDAGDNGKVIYSLDPSAGDMFAINSVTGEIRVMAEFDREVMTQKVFLVVAKDKGEEPQSSTATVIVEILDIDDQVPRFTSQRYYMNITENAPRDTFVGRVNALDMDSPQYGTFSYYVDGTSGSMGSYFRINPENGKLYSKRPFDREVQDLYVVPVLVQSYKSPNQIDRAEVEVRVFDQNDNPPMFTFPSATNNSTTISNQRLPGDYVTRIKAFDEDIGRNAELIYEIVAASSANYFTIDSESGDLFVNSDLSQLHNTNLVLQILVKDSGKVPQMTVGTLIISVNSSLPVMNNNNDGNGVDYAAAVTEELSFTDIIAIIVGAACGTVIVILFLVFIWLFFSKKRKSQKDTRTMPWYSTQPSKSPSNDDLVPDEKTLNTKINKGASEESSYSDSSNKPSTTEKDKNHMIQTGGHQHDGDKAVSSPQHPVLTTGSDKLQADQFSIPQIFLSGGSAEDKDNDSGCADLSQGSNEDHIPGHLTSVQAKCFQPRNHIPPHYSSLQRDYRDKSCDSTTHRPYIEPLPTSGHYTQAPKSFAEWLNSENQHLKNQGHKYKVSSTQDHRLSPKQHMHILRNGSAKKTVRFTEPDKSSALNSANITHQLDPGFIEDYDLEQYGDVKPSISDGHISNNIYMDSGNPGRHYGSLDRRRYLHTNGHPGDPRQPSPQMCAKHHGKYHIGHSNDGSLV